MKDIDEIKSEYKKCDKEALVYDIRRYSWLIEAKNISKTPSQQEEYKARYNIAMEEYKSRGYSLRNMSSE